MLRTSSPPVRPEIEKAVASVLKEDANFDRIDNRSAIRENLTRGIKIENYESSSQLIAFSRNISATGMGLISSEEIESGFSGVLKISRLEGHDLSILSECRWCKPYGEGWFFSGWQFVALKHSFSPHRPSGMKKTLSNADIESAFKFQS